MRAAKMSLVHGSALALALVTIFFVLAARLAVLPGVGVPVCLFLGSLFGLLVGDSLVFFTLEDLPAAFAPFTHCVSEWVGGVALVIADDLAPLAMRSLVGLLAARAVMGFLGARVRHGCWTLGAV